MGLQYSHLRWYTAPESCPALVIPEDYTFRFSGEDDFPWNEWPFHQHRDTYVDRFRSGHLSLCVYRDDSPVHVSWIALGKLQVDEAGKNWTIPAEHACLYDVVTLPEFRRQGLYRAALLLAPTRLREMRRAQTIWIYTQQRNLPSVLAIEAAGYCYSGSTTRVALGSLTLWRRGKLPGDA